MQAPPEVSKAFKISVKSIFLHRFTILLIFSKQKDEMAKSGLVPPPSRGSQGSSIYAEGKLLLLINLIFS